MEELIHFVDPEAEARKVNRTLRMAVFPIQHSRRYYATRAVARTIVLFLLVVFFMAMTSQWGVTPR